MKFKVTSEHVYWWPVECSVPDPDPKKAGKFQKQSFKMQFRAMPKDEAERLLNEIAALPAAERQAREHDLLMKVCLNWDESVVGEDDQPLEFSAAVLQQLAGLSWFRLGVYRAYNQSLTGEEARLGN